MVGNFSGSVNLDNVTFFSGAEGQRVIYFVNKDLLDQWVDKPTRGNSILDTILSTEDNLISDFTVGENCETDYNIIRLNENISLAKDGKSPLEIGCLLS